MRGFFLNAQPMIRNHGSHGKLCDQPDVVRGHVPGHSSIDPTQIGVLRCLHADLQPRGLLHHSSAAQSDSAAALRGCSAASRAAVTW
jgi:hypothetical protein